ncbi:NAD(P)-dependent oxidoreductase [Parashewanella tropica]|uniref:NAD(P)-dependent oxidoreductase n=1 Tax=Parashewanella tropica TaxID=2547970 RepID=UPI00105A5978|nr:NAD(P)-dependent oxidoreductase [Parashewanella tropica]
MAKVTFIGLGVMGYPMAGHLQNQGHQVTVYNRTSSKAEAWVKQFEGKQASTPEQAATGAEIVFVCVGNDDDLRQVVVGEQGALAGMATGTVLVDHTTASAEVARELAETLVNKNIDFIDAPVSGGQAGAENGALTVMAGGSETVFNKVKPVMMAYARCAELIGDTGAGQLAKMVNQICIAGVVQGLAEGLNFAKRAGLDGEKVVEVISKGAAQSWQMENRYQTMLKGEYDFGFAVDWMRKDLRIALDEARKNGSALPLTAMVDQYYSDVQNIGGNRWDTSSLMARLEHFNRAQ